MANGGFQVRHFQLLLLFILEAFHFIDRRERGQRQIVSHINNISEVELESWDARVQTEGIVHRATGELSLFAFSVTCNSISMATTATGLLLVTSGGLQKEPQHPHLLLRLLSLSSGTRPTWYAVSSFFVPPCACGVIVIHLGDW